MDTLHHIIVYKSLILERNTLYLVNVSKLVIINKIVKSKTNKNMQWIIENNYDYNQTFRNESSFGIK